MLSGASSHAVRTQVPEFTSTNSELKLLAEIRRMGLNSHFLIQSASNFQLPDRTEKTVDLQVAGGAALLLLVRALWGPRGVPSGERRSTRGAGERVREGEGESEQGGERNFALALRLWRVCLRGVETAREPARAQRTDPSEW